MKHVDPHVTVAVENALEQCDIAVSPEVLALLAAHLELLLLANQRLNLTRIDEPTDAAFLHVADSLLALPEVMGAPAGTLLDIGTGGGFPGIPLAVAGDRRAVLLDSAGKKARAVQEMIDELGLTEQVTAQGARAEDHAKAHAGEYAVVTTRAVAQLPSLVELASPLLDLGGRLVCLKGVPDSRELERGDAAATQVGLARVSARESELPEDRGARTIVCYVKERGASLRLPRRTGLAQHSPLA